MNAAEIIQGLGGPSTGGGCVCPVCGYDTLSVVDKEGKTLWHCSAGCGQEAVTGELTNRNLIRANGDKSAVVKVPPPWERPIEAAWPRVDENGVQLYDNVKFSDGLIPRFMPRRQKNGKTVWDLKGVRHVLYRLPELMQAVKDGLTIYICEGEKDTDNLLKAGAKHALRATTPGAAESWRDEYAEFFKGADCVVLQDNDVSGERFVNRVCNSLQGVAGQLRSMLLPDLLKKGDISDWLESGNSVGDLVLLTNSTAEWKPAQTTTADIKWANMTEAGRKIGDVEWLFPSMLPYGYLSCLAAVSKGMKSALALLLVDVATKGGKDNAWPGYPHMISGPTEPGYAIWCETEGRMGINYQRAREFGISTDRIILPLPGDEQLKPFQIDNDRHMDLLRKAAEKYKPRLIVLDSLGASHAQKENDPTVGRMLANLQTIAQDNKAAGLVLHHLRKAPKEGRMEIAMDDLRGTSAIPAACVSIIGIDQPDLTSQVRRVQLIAGNLSPAEPSFGIEWEGNDLLICEPPKPPRRDAQVAGAEEILLKLLNDNPNGVLSSHAKREVESQSISWYAGKRALNKLGARTARDPKLGGSWYWTLQKMPWEV